MFVFVGQLMSAVRNPKPDRRCKAWHEQPWFQPGYYVIRKCPELVDEICKIDLAYDGRFKVDTSNTIPNNQFNRDKYEALRQQLFDVPENAEDYPLEFMLIRLGDEEDHMVGAVLSELLASGAVSKDQIRKAHAAVSRRWDEPMVESVDSEG